MSFFSQLLSCFFKKKEAQAQIVDSKKKTEKVMPDFESNEVSYPKASLGYVLLETSKSVHTSYKYNFLNPDKLSADVLQKLKKCIYEIPPMPEVWHQIQRVLQQPDASASDLGVCIAQDPILTAKILKVCNSSAYGAKDSSEINNIPLAIARLGLDEVSAIIFRSLAPDMGASEAARKQASYVWFHSQATAALIRLLLEPSQKVPRHEASLLGMLHDIGKLVILHEESDATLEKLKAMIDSGASPLDAEHAVLGYTHIDAGMMLALHWKLPANIQKVILHHHHPDGMKATDLPEGLQYGMAGLHIAHLILQYVISPSDDEQATSIWSHHKRGCHNSIVVFGYEQLGLLLDQPSFYQQLQLEIERVKLSFPDLFSPS